MLRRPTMHGGRGFVDDLDRKRPHAHLAHNLIPTVGQCNINMVVDRQSHAMSQAVEIFDQADADGTPMIQMCSSMCLQMSSRKCLKVTLESFFHKYK